MEGFFQYTNKRVNLLRDLPDGTHTAFGETFEKTSNETVMESVRRRHPELWNVKAGRVFSLVAMIIIADNRETPEVPIHDLMDTAPVRRSNEELKVKSALCA